MQIKTHNFLYAFLVNIVLGIVTTTNKMEPLFVEKTAASCPFEAARVGNLNALKEHLQKNTCTISSVDEEKRTLIHWAAVKGQLEIVRYLITEKGDPNTVDDDSNYFSLLNSMDRFII